MASAVLSVTVKKCPHIEGIRCLRAVPCGINMTQLFRQYHPDTVYCDESFTVVGKKEVEKDGMTLEHSLLVSDVLHFNMKHLTFECKPNEELEEFQAVVRETTQRTMNAFEVLMARGRDYPKEKERSSGKSEGLHRKDELFNDLLKKYFRANSIDFPKALASSDGAYTLQVLCNALWYLTNHHETINYAAMRQKDGLPIPAVFEDFTGYDDIKRKKSKSTATHCSGT